jgi:hypothetical protein
MAFSLLVDDAWIRSDSADTEISQSEKSRWNAKLPLSKNASGRMRGCGASG